MILNVSGRTDIVAFYTPWFLKRIEEGFVDVRNPFYSKMVSRIYFKDVDCYLFCTKNPLPIVPYLKTLKKPIIFQVTITPYNIDIEPNVKNKRKVIDAVREISDIVGIDNIFVRYDPVFINEKYNVDYHLRAFKKLCDSFNGKVKKIIISFLDNYKNVSNNLAYLKVIPFNEDDYRRIGEGFSEIAASNGMTVQTCFENRNLVEYGFIKGECVSKEYAYHLTGKKFPKWKARGKGGCNCVQLVDIGAYNSCGHLCRYCYANYEENKIKENMNRHDVNSTMLIGHLKDDDIIKVRK